LTDGWIDGRLKLMSKETAKNQIRDYSGKFVPKPDPPLVDIKVTNPVTFLKLWWQKVIANEGVDVRLRIKPLTAIAVALILAAGGFGLGKITFSSKNPIVKYLPQLAPTPTTSPWVESASIGILRFSQTTKKFYLELTTGATTPLNVPSNINLTKYIGKRIFAAGNLNTQTGILTVIDASDLEILPNLPTVIPTVPLTPTPTQIPSLNPAL